MTLRQKMIFGNANNEPERKSTIPKSNKLTLKLAETKRTPNRRIYHWSDTTSKTQNKNKGANFIMTSTFHAACDHTKLKTPSSEISNSKY